MSFVIFQNIDRFLIKNNIDDLTLNLYSTALTLSLISSFFVTAISSSDFPYLKKISTNSAISENIYRKKANKSISILFVASIGLIIFSEYLFYFFSKTYFTSKSLYCLNLLIAVNFYRLKYLFIENRLFILDKVKQILFSKLFILLFAFLLLNIFHEKDALIAIPFSFIITFVFAEILSKILLTHDIKILSLLDIRNNFFGALLIIFATVQFIIQTNELPILVNISFKAFLFIIAITLTTIIFFKDNNFNFKNIQIGKHIN